MMNTNSNKRVAVEAHGALARITLTHPPLNVIDFQMMDELLEALQQLEQRREISVIIISGGERGFSAGVDVAVHTPDKIQTMLQKFHGVIGALVKFPKITIAEVHGVCLGGGAELAMVCDMAYTTPESQVGISGDHAGMLSAGGVHGAGRAGGAEARGRAGLYRTHVQRRRCRRVGAGE